MFLPLLALVMLPGAAAAGAAVDRLDRFRALAVSRPELGQADAQAGDTLHEMYALLDEEVVESLASGSVFASVGFLQYRLDGFADAWGAALARVHGVGALVVGAFALGEAPGGASVRVYGPLAGAPALLAVLRGEGRPAVYPVAPAADGRARFVAAWAGAPSGRGTRRLRLDLVEQTGDGVRVVWSTARGRGEPLLARAWAVAAREIRVRYELHYAGWTPGCDGQTEAEDVYRIDAAGRVTRVARRHHNAWHRELRDAVRRLFEAVAAADDRALATLVPDRELRRRLPPTLAPEPACDAADDVADPRVVSVAATGAATPWELTFRRSGSRWRLISAVPVTP